MLELRHVFLVFCYGTQIPTLTYLVLTETKSVEIETCILYPVMGHILISTDLVPIEIELIEIRRCIPCVLLWNTSFNSNGFNSN
jgi:hypothetical protein